MAAGFASQLMLLFGHDLRPRHDRDVVAIRRDYLDRGRPRSAGLRRRDARAPGAVHQRQLRRHLDDRRRSVDPAQRASHGRWLRHAAPALRQRDVRPRHHRHVVAIRRHALGARRRRSAGPAEHHRPAGAVGGGVRRQHRRHHPLQLLRYRLLPAVGHHPRLAARLRHPPHPRRHPGPRSLVLRASQFAVTRSAGFAAWRSSAVSRTSTGR